MSALLISAEQIKAARAMLGWTQLELAEASGLSLNTVNGFESGLRAPLAETRAILRKTLENKGFEFFGKNGLCRHTDESRMYEGDGSRDKFFDDMLASVKGKCREISAVFWSEEILAKAVGETTEVQVERFATLSKACRVRCLLVDVNALSVEIPGFEFRTTANYRGLPFSAFIFGDKTAVVLSKDGSEFIYFVARSIDVAQRHVREFERFWNGAMPLTVGRMAKKWA